MSDSNEQPTPQTLESRLAAEQEALRNAPKIEIVAGTVKRCYFCGQVTSGNDVHSTVPTMHGELTIHKCGRC